jgi:hypothetical protein
VVARARAAVQRAAEEFGLTYRPDRYDALFASKREIAFLVYIVAPFFEEYGATPTERAKRIEEFLASPQYAMMTRAGASTGLVMSPDNLPHERQAFPALPEDIRAEYERLYERIERALAGREWVVVVGVPAPEQEVADVEATVVHEWVHGLLKDNGIEFQEPGDHGWPWEEGLVTYMTAVALDENLDTESGKIGLSKDYDYRAWARAWREIFTSCVTPEERRAAILERLDQVRAGPIPPPA